MADVVEIRDFSDLDVHIEFKNKGDTFFGVADVPLGIMQNMTRLQNISKMVETEGIEPILEIFDQFLDDPSAELFREHVSDKKIGLRKMMAMIPWMLEQYGLRPTQPSSPSSTGSSDGETGTSSTDGASLNALTLASSVVETPSI